MFDFIKRLNILVSDVWTLELNLNVEQVEITFDCLRVENIFKGQFIVWQ